MHDCGGQMVNLISTHCQAYLRENRISPTTLRQLALSINIDPLLLPDSPHEHPYRRRILFKKPELEVMLARWGRGTHCAPHGHGGSSGAVRILRGEALHKDWRIIQGELKVAQERVLGGGEVVSTRPDIVHSMGDADGYDTLVTLHLYTQAISKMNVYDPTKRMSYLVTGDAGAWLPGPGTQILARHEGLIPEDEF